MQHSILSSPQGQKNRPDAAAAYVLKNVDASKQKRLVAPTILGGSIDSFVGMANLAADGVQYLSTTLSNEGDVDLPHIRYATDIIITHYLAGIDRKDTGILQVLHEKHDSWDVHNLLSLMVRSSRKKVPFIRPTADYLRFAWITSMLNRFFKWNDPLDPEKYNPAHLKETWREKVHGIDVLTKTIQRAFHDHTIRNREDIAAIVSAHCGNVMLRDRSIEFQYEFQNWHMIGYAATALANDPKKLLAHFRRTIKPFIDVRDRQEWVVKNVLYKFRERIAFNVKYLGIEPVDIPEGLVIPDTSFFKKHYEIDNHTIADSTFPNILDRAIITRQFERDGELSPTVQDGVAAYADFEWKHGHAKSHDHRFNDRFRTDLPTPSIAGGTARKGSGRDAAHAEETGDRIGNSMEGKDRDAEPNEEDRRIQSNDQRNLSSSAAEAPTNCGIIGEWIDLILRLLKVPKWFRRLKSDRRKSATRILQQYPEINRTRPPKYIRRILRNRSMIFTEDVANNQKTQDEQYTNIEIPRD